MPQIKEPKKTIGSSDRIKLVFFSFFLFFLFFLLISQFYRVQILEGKKWTKIAESQHCYLVREPFMRGSFFSNTALKTNHPQEKQAFVMDIPKFHLFIDPVSIPHSYKKEIIGKIAQYCSLDQKKIASMSKHFFLKSRSRKIVTWLDRGTKQFVEEWWKKYCKEKKIVSNAIFFVQDYKRSYPFNHLLGQVLHTVQEEKEGDTFCSFPTGGLEKYCDTYLQGKMGKRLILRSLRHSLDTIKVITEPENGADVYLTINHYLQAIVEEELEKGVKEVNAKGGWAVMMDPQTGDVWALAQYPFFNPVNYRDYFNKKEKIQDTRVKAIMDAFEPGSIFKPITLAICMRANEELKKKGLPPLFSPEEKIKTSDGRFPGRSRPLKDGRLHYYLNMNHAIQKSSNIYFGKIVQRVIDRFGDNWYKRALEDIFGFGRKTGIEMPAEMIGLVPTPGKLHPNGKLEWSLGTPYSLAMGHNILVNCMQIVRAYSIIANGGIDVKPRIIKRIVKKNIDGSQKILLDKPVSKDSIRIISEKSASQILRAMKYTTKIGGTAHLADIYGYTEAGKTGTSEKIIDGKYSKSRYISSFVGIAPAHSPRFVLMIVIDEPEVKFIPGKGKTYHGGVCAAPIFHNVGQRSLQFLGMAPDDPYGYPYGDKRRNVKKSDWIKEIKELAQLYNQWNRKK